MYHRAVLLNESIDALKVVPGGTYADLTFGGGSHSLKILERLGNGRLFAFDQDEDALANVPGDDRLTFIPQNFRYFHNYLQLNKALPIDGIIADLGISSHQIDEAERGFSIRYNGRLDMRMDRRQEADALAVVNTYTREHLAEVFHNYGELGNANALAELIINERRTTLIGTTSRLVSIISTLAPRGKENQFYSKVFQSIRIEVNDEIGALKEMLTNVPRALKPGGRVAVISYHSLEDRLVKNFFRSGNFEGHLEKDFYGNPITPLEPVNKKPLMPESDELSINPRARSARLRIAERKAS